MKPTIQRIYENSLDNQGIPIPEARKAMMYVMQTIQKVMHDTDVTKYIDAAIGTADRAITVANAFKILETSDLLEQENARKIIIDVIKNPNPEVEANNIMRYNLTDIFLVVCNKINNSDHQAAKEKFVREIVKIMRLTIQKFDEHKPGFDYKACLDIANEIQRLSDKVVEHQLTHDDIQAFTQATQTHAGCDRMTAALAALVGAVLGLIVGFVVAGVPGAAIGTVAGLGLFGGGYAYAYANQDPHPFTDFVDTAKPLVVAA